VTQFYMPDCSVTEAALALKVMFFENDGTTHSFCLLQGSETKITALSVSWPVGLRGPMYIEFGHCRWSSYSASLTCVELWAVFFQLMHGLTVQFLGLDEL